MTRSHREELVAVAMAVSLVAHLAFMYFAHSWVMMPAAPAAMKSRSTAMRMAKAPPQVKPESIAETPPLEPLKAAPAAALSPRPELLSPTDAPALAEPARALTEIALPTPQAQPLEAASIAVEAPAPVAVPFAKFTVPPSALSEPSFAVKVPPPGSSVAGNLAMAATVSASRPAPPTPPPPKLAQQAVSESFEPAVEVMDKVDERVVEAEKAAVKELINAPETENLDARVELSMTTAVRDEWRYFSVRVRPRQTLPIVPKDVVLLIDASGSVGQDRMASIRGAARQLLRTITNTGDRFNLVAFRDRFSYGFRTWQECTQPAFDRADAWIRQLAAHGRTDVFSTISSVLTLPRDPKRPLIALVVTDGEANEGVSDTAEILSRFTALNDGLISIYMYGIKSSANRELIDVLTHGNRGESLIFDGWRWNAGTQLGALARHFRDPVLTDLRVIPAAGVETEFYPRSLMNLYRGETLEFVGRLPAKSPSLNFTLVGLNAGETYEGNFKLPFASSPVDERVPLRWQAERELSEKL